MSKEAVTDGFERWSQASDVERYTGIEPVSQPWEGRVLPLY